MNDRAHGFAVRGLISSLQMVHSVFPGSGQEMKGLGDDSRPTHKGRHTMYGGLASPDGFPVYAPLSHAAPLHKQTIQKAQTDPNQKMDI